MNEHRVLQQTANQAEIVQQLLSQHPLVPALNSDGVARRVAALERQAPELVRTVNDEADATIEFLGIAALPPGSMYYQGADGTGWVLSPATTPDDAVMPKQEGEALRRIVPLMPTALTYVAHEVERERATQVRALQGMALTPAEATDLVGPIPPPADSVALGERMAHRSKQIVTGLRRTGKIAAGVVVGAVAIPAAAAAAVLAAPVAMVDPIILVAVAAGPERPGAPAAWFRLVAWKW